MPQDHLVLDFPINGPANAKALADELPPLMPDLAKVQDNLGTVHYSRFMIEGDEKLLFLSDIDGKVAQHLERLVESAARVFDAIFVHVDNPPPTPVADNREVVIEWLRQHVREPLDMYFAYEDSSVQDIKACVHTAGFTGNTSQSPLLTYMTIKSRLQGVADKTSFVFDSVFPHVVGGPPTPVAKNAHAFYEWALANNYPPIGFYSAYPDSRFKTSELCCPIIAGHLRPPPDSRASHVMNQSDPSSA